MLIDTHCHINNIIKNEFDIPLQISDFDIARNIIDQAKDADVNYIINVGTSLIESNNCVALSKKFPNVFASVGIHPNDLTTLWKQEILKINELITNKKKNKIVAIGESGLDMYRPGYNLQLQKDAFKMQIEIALKNNLALIVHTRNAAHETLLMLEEFHKDIKRCVIHCFSEDMSFAQQVINWGFFIGIGGTLTYPKNDTLRNVVKSVKLENIVLETDAPFLPPQIIRGQQNSPKYIKTIAQYMSELRNENFETIANQTTMNAKKLFNLNEYF